MTSGDKESSKESKNLQRVSDLVTQGSGGIEYPTLKDVANIDLQIMSMRIQYGRSGDVSSLLLTVLSKGKEITLRVNQRKVLRKLLQVEDKLPLKAKFVKGKRVWDVV